MEGLALIWMFVMAHWLDILVVVLFVCILGYLWYKGKKDVVLAMIRTLVTQAEKEYGSGTGAIKLQVVWDGIYKRLPAIVRLFFTQETLTGYIQDAVEWLDKILQPGTDLIGTVDEAYLLEQRPPG